MIKALALFPNVHYIGIALLLLVCSNKILAQSLSKDAAMNLNPTRYDSLEVVIDSLEQTLSKEKSRVDTILKQSASSTDSVIQNISQRTSGIDSLLNKKADLEALYSDRLLPKPITIPKLPSQGVNLPPMLQESPFQGVGKTNEALSHISGMPGLPDLPNLPSVPSRDQYTKDKDLLNKETLQNELKAKEALPKGLEENDALHKSKAYWNRVNQDSLDAGALTDSVLTTAASKGENHAEQWVKEQLPELPERLMAEHPSQDAMREKLTHEAQDFFAANTAQLETAQEQLSSLKKKYSQLQQQDSVFVKAGSLEEVPIGERLIYGFNLNPDRRTWSSLTASPFVGFYFSKTIAVGASILLNASWQQEPWRLNSSLSGSNVFFQYHLPKDFFTQLEFALEKQSYEVNDIVNEDWQKKLYLGAGKQVKFTKKFGLQALFMFNVLPDNSPAQQQRFEIRMGLLRNTY